MSNDEAKKEEIPEAEPCTALLDSEKKGIEGLENSETCWQSYYNSPLFLVYISHALSSWGDRMWDFTMGMLLIDWEHLQSLRTVAINQLCQATAVLIFGALIGAWVDRTPRLRATVSSIVIQNLCVSASALVLLFLLKTTEYRNEDDPTLWHNHLAIAVSIGFSTLAHLASVACQLTIVKDWVPTLCNEDRRKLTFTNGFLKRIDLSTAILSPILAGGAMELFGPWAGGLVVVCWNIVSAPCEILLLYKVYRRNSILQAEKKQNSTSSNEQKTPLLRPVATLIQGWGTYWRQKVRWSGASLSALYFTVLSFDAVTTGYIRSLCVSEVVVASVRIGSFILGLTGAIVFPYVRQKCGLRLGGALFYVGHCFFLGVALVSVFLPGTPFILINSSSNFTFNETNNNTTALNQPPQCNEGDYIGGLRLPHLIVLVSAMILSRLTLWGSDLSINQGLVERVAANERGVVNGVQNSLNQLVDLIRLITVICVPYPAQFGYLVMATFVFIVGGAVLFIVGAPKDEEIMIMPNNS